MVFFLKNIKSISFNIFTSIILTLIIFLLFKSGFIKNIIGFSIDPFIDLHINYIQWFECYRKELSDETCKSVHMNYGMIFFKIPFSQNLKYFYINYLPYINVALLVSTITFLLNPKNVVEYFILIIIVLSPATLIPLYNFNFEIFIFLMFFIIGVNRIYIINWILYLYCFLLKLYPLVSGVFILIESKKRSLNFIIGLIISLIIIASYFIFIDIKQYSSVSEYYFPIADVLVSGGKPGYWHLFGLNTIPKILKYFELNYIFSIAIVYSIFFYLLYKLIKSYYIKKLLDNENFFNYKWKLFLLGGNILLISFIGNPIIVFSSPFISENKFFPSPSI